MKTINLILHADRADDPLPVNHLAATISDYLAAIDPTTQTIIEPINNVYSWLMAINVLGTQTDLRIKRFFSISHAWESGLALGKHLSDDMEKSLDTKIEQLYGYFDTGGSDSDEPILAKGSNDYQHYNTYQMRISNLNLLPEQCKKNLQSTFEEAEGIFLIGCNTANEDWKENYHPTICDVFAEVIGKVVHGANYYSKVFGCIETQIAGPLLTYEWNQVELAYSEPEPDYPVLLVPGAWGVMQLVKYLLFRSSPEAGPFQLPPLSFYTPPPVSVDDPEKQWTDLYDVIGLYRKFMTPCYPKPGLLP